MAHADDPLVLECTGCGADFLASPAIPVDAPGSESRAGVLCPMCATVQPCGHLSADTVEDAAGQPFCVRCLEENRTHADHH
jgi:hypothetical protein